MTATATSAETDLLVVVFDFGRNAYKEMHAACLNGRMKEHHDACHCLNIILHIGLKTDSKVINYKFAQKKPMQNEYWEVK